MKFEYNTISNSEYLGDRFLNKLGEVGWELVSHTFVPDRHTHYYAFKREKEPQPSTNVREGYWDGCGGSNHLNR